MLEVQTALSDAPRREIGQENEVAFAFDLGNEREYAQLFGESYREFFTQEAGYFASEVYGKLPEVQFEHNLVKEPNGQVSLYIPQLKKRARESYLQPTYHAQYPQWYRDRAEQEYQAILALETQLEEASVGDVFVDLSPTAFNVPYDVRKEWKMGWHSFVRLHQVVEVDGTKKLISKALRNYLTEDGQVELYEELTGQHAQAGSLLASVSKLRPEFELSDITNPKQTRTIKRLTDQLYEKMGKTPVPEDDEYFINQERMTDILKKPHLSAWLNDIFSMLAADRPMDQIVKNFQGWEMAVKDEVEAISRNSDDVNQSLASEIDPNLHYSRDIYMARKYTTGASGCGATSGARGNFDILASPVDELMDYSGISDVILDALNPDKTGSRSSAYHDPYPCPNCGRRIPGEPKGNPQAWRTNCPYVSCGAPINCRN